MKRIATFLFLLFVSLSVFAQEGIKQRAVQYSTYDALSAGLYDGGIRLSELRKYGDMGLGTFENLDGEMVYLDGTFFQIRVDGSVFNVGDEVKSPFATVCYFKQDTEIPVKSDKTFEQIKKEVLDNLPSKNAIYAIRIEGRFKTMTTRSVPAQKPPFVPLAEVVKTQQKTKKVLRMRGDIVGYFFPNYMAPICIEGLHMHFLTWDKKSGGHVLDFVMESGVIRIGELKEFLLIMPQTSAFKSFAFPYVPPPETTTQDKSAKEQKKAE